MNAKLPEALLMAVGDVLFDEREKRTAADRELTADLGRLRERIDEYGNVIETKFTALGFALRDQVTAAVAALNLQDGKDGEPGPAGGVGPAGPAGDRGEAGPAGPPGADAYPGQARGLHDPLATYRAMDVVVMNGCEWRALRDDPGALPGDGWAQGAKRGSKGDKGERGAQGLPGPQGPAGPKPVAFTVDPDTWRLALRFDDGTSLTCDVFPLFNRYQMEAA